MRFWANNPCSLNGIKKDELIARLERLPASVKPQIIFLAETWLGEASDTHIGGYQLHRKDRDGRTRGVVIYTQEDIVTVEVNIDQLNSRDIEQVWSIARFGQESHLLGSMYRFHDCDDAYLENVIKSIAQARQSLAKLNFSSILLYGYFNFSHTWYESLDTGRQSQGM
jgi:hypothetical protein